ncbi:MAG TPA: septal ring lytic transglycosylase RlpA family protein [Dyella sp.]|nr:septal ring lytic transglycosylase RlpA family protein [Dyella sp.]
MRHPRGALSWLLAGVLSLLLAGCAQHRARPSPARQAGVAPRSSAASRGHARAAVQDDIRRDQDSRYRQRTDSVPDGAPLDVSKLVEPTPHVEPRSAYGNKSPYTVLGHTYRVLPSPRGYVARGIASFYGNKFHGYKTSSLETYDMYQFSAAHKTLPLPSYARVTNLANGKSVIVRINDRGPFHANRLIDLSYAAAVKIGIWPKGTGEVEVRAIDPSDPDQAPPPVAAARPAREPPGAKPVPVAGAERGIYLQVGAFAEAANAERLARRLRAANLGQVHVYQLQSSGPAIRRVRVGPLPDAERANEVARRIEAMGLPTPKVAVD